MAVGAAAAGGDRQGTESRLAEHPRDAAQILGIPRRDDDIRGGLIDAVVSRCGVVGRPVGIDVAAKAPFGQTLHQPRQVKLCRRG
ncbi:hypothetical protein B5M44_24465 [Shinella sumterensis]|nr:hypothetical protein B5M44_24465 [Shinella sumterensis]